MTQPVLTVGLLWHSMNSDNLGVGALTMSNIAIIEGVAARLGCTPRFEVIGWTDPRPHYVTRPDIAVTSLRMKDVRSSIARLWSLSFGLLAWLTNLYSATLGTTWKT